jgi:hypothetical protein
MAKEFIGALAASALFFSSTAVAAAGNAGAPQQISPWAALTVLSGGAPAAAVCGAAAVTAAQPAPTGCVLPVMDAPPPPQASAPPPPMPLPVEPAAAGYGISPLLASLAAVALGVGLFFLVKGHHHGNAQPNSPG